jgi:hypothetical protein
MSNRQIALGLTAAYWIVAVVAVMVAPRGGWIDLRWPIAIYFFAIPTTILLWIVVIGVHVIRPALPPSRFALIGVALPLIYVTLGMGAGRLLGEWRGQHLEDQLRVASIAEFDDEPLSGGSGPIGVRLRYSAVYPRGLDLDESHGAFAQLGTSASRNTFLIWRRAVTPRVSGHFQPGTYEITEDFVPAFLPRATVYAISQPTAADRCFRWSPDMSREQVAGGNPEPLAVAIYLAHIPIPRPTKHVYRLADFYAAAAREGAVDCGN